MRVLFVCSGNSSNGISPIIKNQGDSIQKLGVELKYFTIKKRGIKGYLKSIFYLRKYLTEEVFDLVHAHYSMSAMVATFAGAKPLIVSLMGSDVKSKRMYKFLLYFFIRFIWNETIVKTKDMKSSLSCDNVTILPNGVNMDKFLPLDLNTACEKIGWDTNKINILFPSSPTRKEKNFTFAVQAIELCNNAKIRLHVLENVRNEDVPIYLNAANIILLTSLYEGSPNVIKEAMSCNRPIVSVNVGDVEMLISSLNICYLCKPDKYEMSESIAKIISSNAFVTKGRERILLLKIDELSISKKLLSIYKRVCK